MSSTTDDFAKEFSAKLELLAARFRDATGRDANAHDAEEGVDDDEEEEIGRHVYREDEDDVDEDDEDEDNDEDYEDDEDDEGTPVDQDDEFIPILKDLCQLVADSPQPLDHSLIKQANALELRIVDHIESNLEINDSVSPYCPNLVKDTSQGMFAVSMDELEGFAKLGFNQHMTDDERRKVMGERIISFKSLSKVSTCSSPLARFRQQRPPIAESASDEFRAVAEGRCEVSFVRSGNASGLAVSDAIVSAIGLRRSEKPYLAIQLLDEQSGKVLDMEPGLADVPMHIIIDDAFQRIALADRGRIKTFRWALGAEGKQNLSLLPLNTLDSSGFHGPIGSLGNGTRFVRAGAKHLAVWDMDKAPTHGASGTKIIGKKLDPEDVDHGGKFELSSGSGSHRTVRLEKGLGEISKWGRAPGGVSTPSFLCGFEQENRCVQLDAETGKSNGLWIGHGGLVSGFSTSPEDPHAFVTSCLDGVVRLYDVRQPAPVFACIGIDQSIIAATLAYQDGHPFVFVGGTKSESITCWDVRGNAPLYDLSTGNSEVRAMGWDGKRHSLYAAAVTSHISATSGNPIGYRRLRTKIPNEFPTRWPKKAYYDENAFGVVFDAADNRIFRYHFKSDADPNVVPESGAV